MTIGFYFCAQEIERIKKKNFFVVQSEWKILFHKTTKIVEQWHKSLKIFSFKQKKKRQEVKSDV